MATGGRLLLLLMMMMTMTMSAKKFRDCKELLDYYSSLKSIRDYDPRLRSGVQRIYVGRQSRPVEVDCDMGGGRGSSDGGWTVCVKIMSLIHRSKLLQL